MRQERTLSLGVVLGIIALLLFLGLIFAGHFALALAVLVIAAALILSRIVQQRRPPEPGE